VPVDRIKEYQSKLQEFLTTRKAALLSKVLEKKAFDKDLEAEALAAFDEFKTLFK
jgi:F-type H+-transporting ATPase subunit alpha